jgi:hypothetical protein
MPRFCCSSDWRPGPVTARSQKSTLRGLTQLVCVRLSVMTATTWSIFCRDWDPTHSLPFDWRVLISTWKKFSVVHSSGATGDIRSVPLAVAAATREGHIGPDLPASPGRLERRGLEIVGRPLRSRTSGPLYIYCKFCVNLFNIYLVFSPFW